MSVIGLSRIAMHWLLRRIFERLQAQSEATVGSVVSTILLVFRWSILSSIENLIPGPKAPLAPLEEKGQGEPWWWRFDRCGCQIASASEYFVTVRRGSRNNGD